jgi:hypothetical protein
MNEYKERMIYIPPEIIRVAIDNEFSLLIEPSIDNSIFDSTIFSVSDDISWQIYGKGVLMLTEKQSHHL